MNTSAQATQHPFSLCDKIALVTGASQGLGLAIATGLVDAGATVIVCARNAMRVQAAVELLNDRSQQQSQPKAHALVLDITNAQAVSTAFTQIEQQHGRLDILVNNAGTRNRAGMAQLDGQDLRQILEANLVAPYELCRHAARLMQIEGYGRIINISSIAGQVARANDVLYPASKGGLDALTRSLAADLGPHGITVNAIAPGYFATEPNQAMVADPANQEWLAKRTSLGRWGQPEEIAGSAVFLASPAAAYITGHVLAVDGGYLAHF